MQNSISINIENRKIGNEFPCFIVAEAGVNHNGKVSLAKKLIDQAKAVGADAVKFQIFVPDEIATKDALKGNYQKKNANKGETQYEMLKKLALSEDQFTELKNYAIEIGIIFYATPHDLESLDIFLRLDLPILKIASPDLNNGLLLYKIALDPRLRSKPLFISTGGGTLEDVKRTLDFLKSHGFDGPILVYHCTSSYPTPNEEQNLSVLETYEREFSDKYNILVGFSDNGNNILIPADAVVLGAVSIEKHMTLNKDLEGPDHRSSLSAQEFEKMVRVIRGVELSKTKDINHPEALGDGVKRVQASEVNNIEVFRKAIRARRAMRAGDLVTLNDLIPKRIQGLQSPMDFENLLDKKLKQNVIVDQEITSEMVQ